MTNPTFNYDPEEGLGDGFLTPVYFSKHVLVKYLYDPRVSVHFASETYGTVYLPDHYISFGINSKGAVFAWLGDLKKLPHAEQIHWSGENVAPQNDMKSEFFDAQIKAEFTENPYRHPSHQCHRRLERRFCSQARHWALQAKVFRGPS